MTTTKDTFRVKIKKKRKSKSQFRTRTLLSTYLSKHFTRYTHTHTHTHIQTNIPTYQRDKKNDTTRSSVGNMGSSLCVIQVPRKVKRVSTPVSFGVTVSHTRQCQGKVSTQYFISFVNPFITTVVPYVFTSDILEGIFTGSLFSYKSIH